MSENQALDRAASPARADAAEALLVGADLDSEPDGYRALIEQALKAREEGAFANARDLLLRAHALFPNARTLRGMGVLAMDLRDYAEAERRLQAALDASIRPLDPELREVTLILLARARAKLDEQAAAEEAEAQRLDLRGEPALAPSDRSAPSHAPTLEARPRVDPAPISAPPQRRAWKNPWLWGSLALAVVVGGTLAAVLATRPEPGYDRGSAGMLVGEVR